MAELAPGAQVGSYRIVGVAGRGGMGVVYQATQLRLDRSVALKVIAPAYADDDEFRDRFKRESKLAASIEHPNVIPVYEAGEHEGVLFLAMRYVEGTDLGSLVAREGRLDPVRAARFVAQMAAALDAAHAAGLVHRDVKPANALVAADDHLYLTDFGLTKRAASASALTKTGHLVGTVDYVAPEQAEGGVVDARTDVYALGCVLFHLLTGRVPYDKATDMAKLVAHLQEASPAPSDYASELPRGLDAVVARGMAKTPSERWLSAGDLGRAAVAAAEERPVAEPERSVARGEAAPSLRAELPPTVAAAASETVAAGVEPAGGTATAAGGGASPASRSHRRLLAVAAGAAVALAALGVAMVLVTGGDSAGSSADPSAESSGTTTVGGSGAAELTTADAVNKVYDFADDFSDACLGCLEESFAAEGFRQTDTRKTCSAAPQPMSLDAALADYTCNWQIRQADMKLAGISVDRADRTVSASYTLVFKGDQTGSGKVTLHLVPRRGQAPLIDAVAFSAGSTT